MAVDGQYEKRSTVAEHLLAFYDAHARNLPWRSPPGTPAPDPYRVWLSEIMLQQTTVGAVMPYFRAFTTRWPTVEALAAEEDGAVMAAWAGLGYYARARNLLACARVVASELGGRFPEEKADLLKLPGVGAYTAAAIAAIAFGKRAVAVDANVERVVSRLFAIETPLPAGRAAIRAAADSITPDRRAGDFAQAMMDLGSSICTARAPACLSCPLVQDCAGYRTGDPAHFPVKAAKRARPERQGTVWWIEREGQVWLVRRPAKGLLGGMRALPTSDWVVQPTAIQPPVAGTSFPAGRVAHGFTHFSLTLSVERIAADVDPEGGGEWWPITDIEAAGLPTLFAKAAARAIAAGQEMLVP